MHFSNPVPATPVLVTGASGYIALHLVQQLLARGYRVRGTVRSLANKEALGPLLALPGAERLELVEANLLRSGDFDRPAQGCQAIFHTASPYTLDAQDPQRDLVDPAVEGTLSLLKAAQKARVQRVILTSSMAAVTDEPDSDKILTEADWNDKSSLTRNPYYFSKAEAERAAWRFMEVEKPSYDLVVINPFLVIGPSLAPPLNPSNQLLVDLLKGVYPGIMNLTWGFVDVRDVAEAHLRALLTPGAHGRYLCAGDTVNMRAMVELLVQEGWGPGNKLPKLSMDCAWGDYAVRLSSYLQPKGVGSYLRTHVGRVPRYDNRKIQQELGLKLRPATESILDTLADLVRWGHISPKSQAT